MQHTYAMLRQMQEKPTALAHILGSMYTWEPHSRRDLFIDGGVERNSERLQERNVRNHIFHIFCLRIEELV